MRILSTARSALAAERPIRWAACVDRSTKLLLSLSVLGCACEEVEVGEVISSRVTVLVEDRSGLPEACAKVGEFSNDDEAVPSTLPVAETEEEALVRFTKEATQAGANYIVLDLEALKRGATPRSAEFFSCPESP